VAARRALHRQHVHSGRKDRWSPEAARLHIHFVDPAEIADEVPDEIGLGLMRHAYTEFTMLSKFPPSLFYAENRRTHAIPLPW
jgi:hypothetical protein